MSKSIDVGWLKEWIDENKRHRTLNDGKTIACSKIEKYLDAGGFVRDFHYCPLCGTELGKITEEENYNFSWQF